MKKLLMFLVILGGIFLNKSKAETSAPGDCQSSSGSISQASMSEEEQELLKTRLQGLGYFR